MKKTVSKDFPRIVTNGWQYRIELKAGEFYTEFCTYTLFRAIIYWRTFRGARRQLRKMLREQVIHDAPWRPVSNNTL